ncbi:MAG: 30S ribosomal protein S1 [Proteobacteria bacterium]|nr:30S ribosomal protein S1 [Pseudomonadota bacterium]
MHDELLLDEELLDEENFEKIFEESLKPIQDGEVVTGKVLQITPDYVVIDVGYKSEGQIPIYEFNDINGSLAVKVGDVIDVLVEEWENENGMMVLSKQKADQRRVWDVISEICDKDSVIEGKILSRIKGGLTVDIGLKAFLPGSQVDLHPVRNLDKFIGETQKFKILKYNRKRGNVVLSRRAILETERESLRSETIKNLQDGAIVDGVIKNITDYGVFIDLGGIDGLLHITDISWGRVNSPGELFATGDKIKVKVLSYDQQNQRVSLGYKQIREDPWGVAEKKYVVNTRVSGKVVNITNYGAFVELEEGIEGLIHISEMSWTKKVKHPSQILTIGDMVDAVVLDLDVARKRISLGLKQTEPNPWSLIEEKYPKGTVIEGKIKNVTDFGIFIGIDEGIDGLVHISDISWTQKIKHPVEVYKKGQMVKAVVLSIDKENERFSLGIKQLEPDPWESVPKKYRRGQVVKGVVTNVTDFGIFLEIEKGVEGLIHVSEISKDKVENLKDFANVNDELEVLIISIDKRGRKIGLSIRDLKEVEDQRDLQEYMAREEQAATTTLGDVLKGELQQKAEKDELPAEEASGEIEETTAPDADNEPLSAGDDSPVAEKDELPAEEASGEIKETAAPDADSVPLSGGDDSPVADDEAAKDDKQE